MTSEDVIHDFGLPDFRLKRDVLPGRYEAMWLQRRPGRHIPPVLRPVLRHRPRLDGGQRVGHVRAGIPAWLEQNGTQPRTWSPQGKALFIHYGCSGCHQAGLSGGGGTVRAPSLNGVYMSPVPLPDGSTVIADDRYIHDSHRASEGADRRELRAADAVVRGRDRRGGPGEDHRLHQVPRPRVAGGERTP